MVLDVACDVVVVKVRLVSQRCLKRPSRPTVDGNMDDMTSRNGIAAYINFVNDPSYNLELCWRMDSSGHGQV